MTDEVIPIGHVQPSCPQCGAQLLIEQLGVDPEGHDRVFCADHGTIGTREEIHAQVYEQHRDEIVEHAKSLLPELLKGFSIKRG